MSPRRDSHKAKLIVGIGASAGGLSAFKTFFDSMPPDSGMAFVLIQHLDPHHKSMLVELLARHTDMPVMEAVDGAEVAPNHVFVIPPDATLCIRQGALEVLTPAPPRHARRPIDAFFTSLAEDQGENAVCIVLSGSGSDGSIGLRDIKDHGGLCLAQTSLDESGLSGMPDSAAATGLVDCMLPVQAMPAKLVEYHRHLSKVAGSKDGNGNRRDMAEHLRAIATLLRARLGHDFREYKDNTMVRRVQRRMQVLQIATVPEYIEHLRKEPDQVEALYRDLLIGVTQFFRDTEAFQALQAKVIPRLLEKVAGKHDNRLRIWVPGCATGEEVFSIAIAFQEVMQEKKLVAAIQIFGSDIDDKAIAIARAGRYGTTMTGGISPERLERWFVQEGKDYCPIKQIRDMCIFAQHSLVKDPPFSKLDLISCRNVLIYLNGALQARLLGIFHYALQPGGYLFVGPAEGVSRSASLFEDFDKKRRIFKRIDGASTLPPPLPAARREDRAPDSPPSQATALDSERLDRISRRVMEKYTPPYVVVDSQDHILQFSGGDLGAYLQPSSGKASLALFSVLRKALRPTVHAALEAVRKGERAAAQDTVAVTINGQRRITRVIVEPVPERNGTSGHCIVAFDPVERLFSESVSTASVPDADGVLRSLEQELRATRAQLTAAIDELETANEEMRSSNEEYQSVNEEMQATNEELETSKEEMQSINEELQTLNIELNGRNEALATLNSDLKNLVDSSHIATIFLDSELRIRNFTPSVEDLFSVRSSDRGRPLTDLVTKLNYSHLERDARKVLRTLSMIEAEVQLASQSATFIMRIRPYLTVTNVLDGLVITFIDITQRYREEIHRSLLVQELNHRVKNTLATVLSIATQSLKGSTKLEDFRAAFIPRVLALSRTHDLLTQQHW